MNIVVFDTETTDLSKCFCYNVGFVIYDTEEEKILCKREFIVEQIWHNLPLFSTAYYAEKRPIYVKRMKGRKIKLDKWGYICQTMSRLFKLYNVQYAYAYNSKFDERVFEFNCDWFKTINPFDNIPILDILTLVHKKIAFSKDFQSFCEKNKRFTDSGNYSTTAETLYQYCYDEVDFTEEHTALSDSLIELAILTKCISLGCRWGEEYKKYSSIPRKVDKEIHLIDKTENEPQEYIFNCQKITISKDRQKITLR